MIDALAARQLQEGKHLTDPAFPGLRLVATKTKRTWIYRYRSPVDNSIRQIPIGHWPKMPESKAQDEWSVLKKRRDTGEDPAMAKRQTRLANTVKAKVESYTVRNLCDDYLQGHVDNVRKPKGAVEMRRLLTAHLKDLDDRPAASITRTDAFNLIERLKKSIPSSTMTLRGELGAAWDYALDAGRLPDTVPNWWRLVQRGKIVSKGKKLNGKHIGSVTRALSQDEVGRLINYLPQLISQTGRTENPLIQRRNADALALYLWTGARGCEICWMEKDEISKEKDGWWWTLPKHKTKNARFPKATDLRVPLVGRALDIVTRRMKEAKTSYLFPSESKNQPWADQAAVSKFVSMNKAYMPVAPFGPHDLRRTTRTLLASLECPKEVAESILGHMVGVYDRHHYDPQRRHWITVLDQHLEYLAAKA